MVPARHVTFDPTGLSIFFSTLQKQGYEIVAPTVRDAAIAYDVVNTPSDLPIGWTDGQEAGHYRLKKRDDQTAFGYNVGPHSWKKYLLPARMKLWEAQRDKKGFTMLDATPPPRKLALIGVRACELHAMAMQDAVFIEGVCVDPFYKAQTRKPVYCRGTVRTGGKDLFLRFDEHRPEGGFRLRPCLDRGHRRGEALFRLRSGIGTRAGRLGWPRNPGIKRNRKKRGECDSRKDGPIHGPHARHHKHQNPALRKFGTFALE